MSLSFFGEKSIIPNNVMVEDALGNNKLLWDDLESRIVDSYADIGTEWKFYSKKAGWSLLVKQKKRTLLYLVPLKNYFKVWFVFGRRAVDTAKEADLPKEVIDKICESRAYVEGTLFDIDVRDSEDIKIILTLLQIKTN